ncbi:MAG: vWA domain-containing protein [Acidimicrobiales bacterium]
MTPTTAAVSRLAAARLWAAESFPYFTSALLGLRVVWVEGLGTCAVDDGFRLYVDPETAAAWTADELGAVLVHEVGHVIRDHAGRVGDRRVDPILWNWACDMEINDDLERAQLPLPGAYLHPGRFGLASFALAEEYYRQLLQRTDLLDGTDASELLEVDCGPGAHGVAGSWTVGDDDVEAPALTAIETEILRARVTGAILATGQGPGGASRSWRRWADERVHTRLDWRRQLARVVRGAMSASGSVDYSYRRPSRRASCTPGVVTPSMVRPLPSVSVVVDTSASVDAKGLAGALSHIDSLARHAGARVAVLSCDTVVHHRQRVIRGKDVQLVGGGGTDMRVGLAAAAEARPRPSVIVVLTDGRTPWPSRPPRATHVVLVLFGDKPILVPRWAAAIRVPANEAAIGA